MTHKHFSLLVLSHNGSSIKHITVSRFSLIVVFLLVLGLASAAGYVIRDYDRLKRASLDAASQQDEIAAQRTEIASQRRQIQTFAADINTLKGQLTALQSFENKIRIIANLEEKKESEGLFGMGGALPEDLDPRLPLERKHNGLLRQMHAHVDHLGYATGQQGESFESLLGKLEEQVNLLACTPAIRPCKGWLTSRFGYRKSPITGRREFHKGHDIATRKGTPILVSADGVVKFTGSKGLLGKVIVIDHGYGMITRYAHVHKILKKVGQKVERGETIATVGNTGRSTGPHLHYEVHLNGVPVNPARYILN